MERTVKVGDSSSVIYKLNNHESQTQFTLGLYLDIKSVSDPQLLLLLEMLPHKYPTLTIYYCTSSDSYLDGRGRHTLPYYELYQWNKKIAGRIPTGPLFVNELKTFIEIHLPH